MLRFEAVKTSAWPAVLALVAATTAGPLLLRTAQAQSPPATSSASSSSMRELARQVALDLEHRAVVAERDGQPTTAEALLRRAMDADPGYLPPYLGYARLLAARGRAEEAARVLSIVPGRAIEGEHDVVELARARAGIGDLDGALELLTARPDGVEATRARAQLCAQAGRFPEALLAARRLADLVREPAEMREARVLVRALGILVGDADAVRVPGEGAGALRRVLAQ
jgi:thioredoxin-like negative regulator of GroEL